MGKDTEFKLENYDGGLPSHPTPEASGRFVLTSTEWQIHYGGKGVMKGKKWIHGGLRAHPLKPTATGPNSCHVAILSKDKPAGAAFFDLPETSEKEFVLALGSVLREGGPSPSSTDQEWWTGIKPRQILYPCHYTDARDQKEKGSLNTTDEGIRYKGPPVGGAKIGIAWRDIANIEITNSQARHGTQRSAIGVGPVGVAVVGATMLHNRRAAGIDTVHVISITNHQGEQAHFVTDQPEKKLEAIQAIIARLPKSTPPAPSPVASHSQTPAPASTPVPAPPGTPAGWLPDPVSQHELRYWDGSKWTEHVSNEGEQTTHFL